MVTNLQFAKSFLRFWAMCGWNTFVIIALVLVAAQANFGHTDLLKIFEVHSIDLKLWLCRTVLLRFCLAVLLHHRNHMPLFVLYLL